jgi:3-mercaptopyruvate sulfurtransferase SseA
MIGYANVRVMYAGISGWLAAKLPTESGERARASQEEPP